MLHKKIAEMMISLNENETNYRSAVIGTRLRQIITTVLSFSETPAATLWVLGIYFDKKYLQIKLPTFAKTLFLPQRVVYENMLKEGFIEIPNQNKECLAENIRVFQLPDNKEGQNISAAFNNQKFATEVAAGTYLKERREVIVNSQNSNFDNKKNSIKLPPNYTFTTSFHQSTMPETTIPYLNFDIRSTSGTPAFPKVERTANPNTVFIIDPTSTWMSTLEVKPSIDVLLPQLIAPPIEEES